jgi:hypothetical protein
MTDPISSTVQPQCGRPTDIWYDTWMGGNQPAYTGRATDPATPLPLKIYEHT